MAKPRKYFSEEERIKARRRIVKESHERRKQYFRENKRVSHNDWVHPFNPPRKVEVPVAVLAERERLRDYVPNPNQAVLGDPLPGRSALDQSR